jgi:predicted nucleic acid-binding protein
VTTFVDTNVLVYAHDLSETQRRPVAQVALDELWRARTGILSTQVLSEFYVVATRKFDPPMPRAAARRIVGAYTAWPVVQVDGPLILAASTLEDRHTLSFWDALIIEAAARGGAARLLSEDLPTSRRIRGVTIENPFAVPCAPPRRDTGRWLLPLGLLFDCQGTVGEVAAAFRRRAGRPAVLMGGSGRAGRDRLVSRSPWQVLLRGVGGCRAGARPCGLVPS